MRHAPHLARRTGEPRQQTAQAWLGYHVVVAGEATATRSLPGAGGEDGVDATVLQRAALDAMADRIADVLPNRAILALPVVR
jgi:hypothetical protein